MGKIWDLEVLVQQALCHDHTNAHITHTHRLARTQRKADFPVASPATMMNCGRLFSLFDCISLRCLRKQLGWHRTKKKCECVGGEQKCQQTLVDLHT